MTVHYNPSAERKTSFITFSLRILFLVFLFYPVYGCGEKDSQKNSEIPVSEPAVSEPAPAAKEISLTADELAGLGETTQKFTETFQETDLSDPSPVTAEEKPSNVSEDVQNQYTRLPDISFAPTIVDRRDEKEERYQLRYKFDQQTNLSWNVAHRVRKRVLMSGLETEIETVSQIVRRWQIGDEVVSEDTSKNQSEKLWNISYFIDQMILDQHETGKDPVRYDSRIDEEVPLEIAAFGTEKAVGRELSRFKLDQYGMMTEKEKMMAEYGGNPKDSRLLFPFPSEPVAVGETWTLPYTIYLQNRDKSVKTINAVLKFTLNQVSGDLAVIETRTVPISLIGDPYLEGQLAERLFTGTCRFDMAGGKAIRTEIMFSRSVPDAYGAATYLDYQCTVTEEYNGISAAE